MTKLFVAAALAAALAQPAAAVTFPQLTTIYVGPGVQDTTGSSATTGTLITCSNVSGATAAVRILFLTSAGGIAAQTTISLLHGATRNITTRVINSVNQSTLATGAIDGGVVNIESTQSGVFCSAMILDSATSGPNGAALHLIRVNPHPGTVE